MRFVLFLLSLCFVVVAQAEDCGCAPSEICRDRGDGRNVCIVTQIEKAKGGDYCASSSGGFSLCKYPFTCQDRGDKINACIGGSTTKEKPESCVRAKSRSVKKT